MSSKARNFVHIDEIWKDHVQRETQSFTRKWPERWGYLTEEYRQMNRGLQGLPPDQPTEKSTVAKLPPLRSKPQPVSWLPVTTAQLMGWYITRLSAKPLEIYRNNDPAPAGFLKLVNWPTEHQD